MQTIRLFESFAGFGGASFALKKVGIPFKTVGYSEIDKYAIQCYEQNHGEVYNYGDITKINPNNLPDFDFFTGGFPCQSFSIAGKREGFESKKTGNLFFDIIRIIKVKQPKYVLLENVKGILSQDDGKTHATVIKELKQAGYGVAWKCLSSKNYGIPQNRERVWYVCKLGGWDFMEFIFPQKTKLKLFLKDILEEKVDEKYYLNEYQRKRIKERSKLRGKDYLKRINPKTAFCLTTRKPVNCPADCTIIVDSPKPRIVDTSKSLTDNLCSNYSNSYCLTTNVSKILETENNWRQFTPRECFRLQGFLDDEINLDNISDSAKYKLAGNGWDVNLVSKIMKSIFKEVEK